MTSRGYLYTIWNVTTEQQLDEFFRLFAGSTGVKYSCGQIERCPETQRLHLQLYVEYEKPQRGVRLSKLFKLNSVDVHFQPRRGSPEQARDYCSKEETRVCGPRSFGTFPSGQGYRTDLATATEDLLKHKSLRKLSQEHPTTFVKYHRGFTALLAQQEVSDQFEAKTVEVYWGATGTGKTRKAFEENPGLFRASPPSGTTYWFDGYNREDCILIDDYSYESAYPIGFFLQLLDGRAIQAPVKGGFTTIVAGTIIITSNQHPDHWYPKIAPHQRDAMSRRFTSVVEFK